MKKRLACALLACTFLLSSTGCTQSEEDKKVDDIISNITNNGDIASPGIDMITDALGEEDTSTQTETTEDSPSLDGKVAEEWHEEASKVGIFYVNSKPATDTISWYTDDIVYNYCANECKGLWEEDMQPILDSFKQRYPESIVFVDNEAWITSSGYGEYAVGTLSLEYLQDKSPDGGRAEMIDKLGLDINSSINPSISYDITTMKPCAISLYCFLHDDYLADDDTNRAENRARLAYLFGVCKNVYGEPSGIRYYNEGLDAKWDSPIYVGQQLVYWEKEDVTIVASEDGNSDFHLTFYEPSYFLRTISGPGWYDESFTETFDVSVCDAAFDITDDHFSFNPEWGYMPLNVSYDKDKGVLYVNGVPFTICTIEDFSEFEGLTELTPFSTPWDTVCSRDVYKGGTLTNPFEVWRKTKTGIVYSIEFKYETLHDTRTTRKILLKVRDRLNEWLRAHVPFDEDSNEYRVSWTDYTRIPSLSEDVLKVPMSVVAKAYEEDQIEWIEFTLDAPLAYAFLE